MLCLSAPGAVSAAQTQALHGAGIVVDYGDGRVAYAYVPFVEEELTGIELLRRSGIPLLSVPFGGLGEAVCSVGGTGCDVGECRRRVCQTGDRSSPFWQYMRQSAPGEWEPFALGASQSTVQDGDIDGWAWTGTPPELPAVAMEDLIELAGAEPVDEANVGDPPVPAVRTYGGDLVASNESPGFERALVGGIVLIGVVMIGGLALWRTRRAARSADW